MRVRVEGVIPLDQDHGLVLGQTEDGRAVAMAVAVSPGLLLMAMAVAAGEPVEVDVPEEALREWPDEGQVH